MSNPNPPIHRSPDRGTLASFVVVVLLSGANAVAIQFIVRELPPFWSGAVRYAIAALVFAALAVHRRERFPRGRALGGVLAYGAMMFGVGSAFVNWGLAGMSAGLAQIIYGLTPLLTLVLASAHGDEPFRLRPLIGALLALAGIALAFGQAGGGTATWPRALAIFLGALSTAEATVMARRQGDVPPLATNTLAMIAGALTLLLVSLVAGEPRGLSASVETWLAMGYLILLGSLLLYFLFLVVVRRWTASATSYVFVLAPLATIALVWLAGEPVTPLLLAGGALVVAGVWYGALSGQGEPLAVAAAERESAD